MDIRLCHPRRPVFSAETRRGSRKYAARSAEIRGYRQLLGVGVGGFAPHGPSADCPEYALEIAAQIGGRMPRLFGGHCGQEARMREMPPHGPKFATEIHLIPTIVRRFASLVSPASCVAPPEGREKTAARGPADRSALRRI